MIIFGDGEGGTWLAPAKFADRAQTAKRRLTLSRRWIERIASAKRAATLTTLQFGGSGSAR